MTTFSVITVLTFAELIVAAHDGRLLQAEPPLYEHPTLVAMFEQHNLCRAQNNLAKQPVSPYLTEMAQAHANWMANSGRFEHNYSHGYPEIIYWNAQNVESAFVGWMNSGPHRSIILNGCTHIGYGYAIGANGQTYWCGVFGNMGDEKPVRIKGTLVSAKKK